MYHITKSRSKVKPFNVVNVGDNGEVLSSHLLKTKQACFKNISRVAKGIWGAGASTLYFWAQDDTLELPLVYKVFENGTKEVVADEVPDPKYIPGRNPKKKKK